MPRTPPPPHFHPPEAESVPPERKDEGPDWEDELEIGDLGDDPHPSPYERITIVPAVPEKEYVANMMGREGVESVPPSSERPREPRTGVTQTLGTPHFSCPHLTSPLPDPSLAASDYPEIDICGETVAALDLAAPARPTPPEGPLTLDLFDPVLPPPDPLSMAGQKSGDPPWPSSDPPGLSSLPPWPSNPPPGRLSSQPAEPSSQPPRSSNQPPRSSNQPPHASSQPPHASSQPPHASSQPPQRSGRPFVEGELPTGRRPSLTFGKASGDALELVTVRASSAPPAPATEITVVQVRDRFEVGDFSGALLMAEAVLECDPENAEALLFAEHCRDVLKRMYLSRLGGLKRVPSLAMTPEQQRWLSLDHRAGFVLSLVDGTSSIDEVLDISGMPELDALRILCDLLQQNVIKLG